MRRSVVLLVAAVVIATLAGPVAAHPAADDEGYDPRDDIKVTYELRPTVETGTVRVTVTARLPSQLESFEFQPPASAEVQVLDGFTPGGDDLEYRWNGEAERPSMTYLRAVNESGVATRTAAGAGWAILTQGDIGGRAYWRYYGTAPEYYSRIRPPDDTPGWVGETLVVTGPHRIEAAERHGERFELVILDHASMAADPADVFDSLGYARQELDMGHAHQATVGVVQPAELQEGGFVVGGGWPEFAVHEGQLPEGTGNTWIHEYVHTRQNFSTTEGLEWIVEASAEYEAALLTLQHGNATWFAFQNHVTSAAYADANLRTRTHGETPYADYRKGAAVLARMNERGETVTPVDFKRIVADVAGESMDETIDRLVTEPIDPEPPTDPFLYTTGAGADNDRDGLTTREERAAGSHPFQPDTDGDGVFDGKEVEAGTDPAVPNTATIATTTPTEAPPASPESATTPGGDGAVGLPAIAALAGVLALAGRMRRRYSS